MTISIIHSLYTSIKTSSTFLLSTHTDTFSQVPSITLVMIPKIYDLEHLHSPLYTVSNNKYQIMLKTVKQYHRTSKFPFYVNNQVKFIVTRKIL